MTTKEIVAETKGRVERAANVLRRIIGVPDYDRYVERKSAALDAEAKQWAEFDRTLAKEETWIRTGIQARRTRNEGRVRALEALRVERRARRDRIGSVKLQAQEAERSGTAVAVGGRALTEDVRAGLPYTTHGDRMSHLSAFARSIHPRTQQPSGA